MKPSVTMMGVPSSGKSTIGAPPAKRLGFPFMDVDIVIQGKKDRLLKEIIAQEGMDGFLKIEERINAEPDATLSVIAPDGSVIHGERAMERLEEISEAVYLKMNYEEMEEHIGNAVDRGAALRPGFTLRDLYNGRMPYYERYADTTIDEEGKTPGDTVDALKNIIEGITNRNMIERIVEEQKKILGEENRKIEAYEAEIAALRKGLAFLRTAEAM